MFQALYQALHSSSHVTHKKSYDVGTYFFYFHLTEKDAGAQRGA